MPTVAEDPYREYNCRKHGPQPPKCRIVQQVGGTNYVHRTCPICPVERAKALKDARQAKKLATKRRVKAKARDARLYLIKEYGGKCVCCGETEPKFLTVDHIDGKGGEHRRADPSAVNLTIWLEKRGYPKDNFQLLCWTCNIVKSKYGRCPHTYKRRKCSVCG